MQTFSESELAALDGATLASLRQQWIALFDTTPPKALHRDMMVRALAWRLQTAGPGDLSTAAQRDLGVITAQARAKRLATASPAAPQPASTRLKPSTQLVRVWHGTTYTVEVTDAGYEWEGAAYRSLSEIARLITGTRWNGLLFFGLRERTRRDAAAPPPSRRSRKSEQQKSAHAR